VSDFIYQIYAAFRLDGASGLVSLIAEISGNHNGSLDNCKNLIKSAQMCGADYVKIQTYSPDTMTLDIDHENFTINKSHKLWGGQSLYELYENAQTPWGWHQELFNFSNSIGMKIFSTPFDKTAVDLLEELNTPIYKIASMESGDIPLIKYIAQTQKPVIASTGSSTIEEIDELVETIYSEGNKDLTLLLCTSAYPTPHNQVHLARMELLRERYNIPVGLSDHTLGNSASLAAVAMGATVIERHFILNRNEGGADSAFSLEPNELRDLSIHINQIVESVGNKFWQIQPDESESRRLRRSLIITIDVQKGDVISDLNVKSLRPNIGISPKFYEQVLGKTFNAAFSAGTALTFDKISEASN
jgi:pseudaminic acid synthase